MDFSNKHLEKEYFTSLPIAGQAFRTRSIYQLKLKISLNSLISSVEKGLKIDLSHLKIKVSALDPKRRFCPRLHYLHHRLQDGIRNSNIFVIKEIIYHLTAFGLNDIYSPELNITTGIKEDWEIFLVSEIQKSTAVDGRGRRAKVDSDPISSLDEIKKWIQEAKALLQQNDPILSEQVNQYVSHIKVFEGEGVIGMTDVRAFGAVFLRKPENGEDPIPYFIEHLIHETSHLHLNSLMSVDPIILNSPEELYAAPIRLDPRPMYGIFHATFVLSRIVRFFRLATKTYPSCPNFKKSLQLVEQQFNNGVKVVTSFADCTEFGSQIVNSFEHTANSLL